MTESRFVGNPLACRVHSGALVQLRGHHCAFLRRATQPLENVGNFLNSHSQVRRYFFSASARVAMVTFISTRSFGLSFPSRGTPTILSTASIPEMTLPNTV